MRNRRLAIALIAATATIFAAAAARAQAPESPSGAPDLPTGDFTCPPGSDCHANQVISGNEHEDRAPWVQVAGAPHPETTPIEGSGTPFDVDLFAVRARNAREAVAGGAVCEGEVPPEEVDSCERVPVIYSTDEDHPWHQEYRAEGPGYVGAIAWIKRGEALAVGGTGTYPRGEPNPPGDQWDYEARVQHDREHGAGEARAWHFHDGDWEDISEELPEGMGGLSALDLWAGREPNGDEWGVAGGYGQLWEWQGGRFTGSHVDRTSQAIGAEDPEWAVVDGPLAWARTCDAALPGEPQNCHWDPPAEAQTSSPDFLQFRVREIRVAPDRNQKRVIAFTAGCCGHDGDGDGTIDEGGSRRIEFRDAPKKNGAGVSPDAAPPREGRPRWVVSSDDTYGDSVYSFALKMSRFLNGYNSPDEFGEPQPNNGAPVWDAGETVVARGEAGEETPLVQDPRTPPEPRYVASDGDSEPGFFNGNLPITGDGVPDWKVGEAPPVRPEWRGLGVLATTVTANKREYGGVRPYCDQPELPSGVGVSQPEAQVYPGEGFSGPYWDATSAYVRVCRIDQYEGGQSPYLDPDGPVRTHESGIQVGPSWSLNAIDVRDTENVGYAVGDRGAILRYGSPPVESDPPSLGTHNTASLADGSPYAATRPSPAGETGEVPALASRPRAHFDDPQMFSAGSADGNEIGTDLPAEDTDNIVMSRDGSEGWAIGPSPEAQGFGNTSNGGLMTLHHYQGGQWTRCDPVGDPGLTEPDPACSSLAEIYKRPSAYLGGRIRLDTAARIPLENDSDPSNDDEFEILGTGTTLEKLSENFTFRYIPTIVRYREGRWRLEPYDVRSSLNPPGGSAGQEDLTGTSLACVGPDECWFAGHTFNRFVLARYDGRRWIDCSRPTTGTPSSQPLPNRTACGDLGNRLPGMSSSIGGAGASPVVSVSSAGNRVYLAGIRLPSSATGGFAGGVGAPVILYKDRGAEEQWSAEGGGYDPGFQDASAGTGAVMSVAVARRADGSYEGWATGAFDAPITLPVLQQSKVLSRVPLLRLDPGSGEWHPYTANDAARDYLGNRTTAGFEGTVPERQVTLPGVGSTPGRAYIATRYGDVPSHLLVFNPDRGRWELAQKPGTGRLGAAQHGRVTAVAPDNRGGVWTAVGTEVENNVRSGLGETYYYDYTEDPPRQVFSEVDHPLADRERLTDLAGSPDGSVWVTTNQGSLYRHDRIGGWERVVIPGWDPGRVVTRRSPALGLALGPDGAGLAVGEAGRIAELTPTQVRLDQAAGSVCAEQGSDGPCGTSFDLNSAAIAPGGAALVGGEKLILLWRPGGEGGAFRRVPAPDASSNATITGIAMPSANSAWLALSSGQLFAGTGDGAGGWHWQLEDAVEMNGVERLLTEDRRGEPVALHDIAVDASGHGFAVGDKGVVLERWGDRAQPWRRVDAGVTEKLTSVALPGGSGSAGLIGGERGLVLTRSDGIWQVARAGDQLRPDNGFVAGVALLPGYADGQVEAWAGVAPAPGDTRTGTSQLLHYTNAPQEPLLDPEGPASQVLPDAPAPRDGEISFAALGRSDCHLASKTNLLPCPPLENGDETEQTLLRRVRDAVVASAQRPGGPQFAIFTGDAYDSAGNAGTEPVEQNSRAGAQAAVFAQDSGAFLPTSWTGGEKLRRFNEQVTDFLPDHGVPTFASIGARDLSEARGCFTTTVTIHCVENRDQPRAGDNLAWRQAMETEPAPWGGGGAISGGSLSFEPIPDSENALRASDSEVDDPSDEVPRTDDPSDEVPVTDIPQVPANDTAFDESSNNALPDTVGGVEVVGDVGDEEVVGDRPVPAGGASTHYAADIVRDGKKVARLIVVDTSEGSLTASDPVQQPFEPDGQRGWLEGVLCIKGSLTDTGQCTRDPSQQAIVVSSTPTYSYGPTTPTETQVDGTLLESILLQHHANVVVSGRLGWNGRYWALAPGLHEPCPGQAYVPDYDAPKAGSPRLCDAGPGDSGPDPNQLVGQVQGAVGDLGGTGALPFVVASNAGGRFNDLAEQGGQTSAANGFWRGYTVVRLDPSGDSAKTVVEQRPILDWIGLSAKQHVLRANQKLTLEGRGREPLAAPLGQLGSGRFDELATAAITHRYELLEADPDRPWLPKRDGGSVDDSSEIRSPASQILGEEDPCGPYLCLNPKVGAVGDQSGQVKAGKGNYPRTFAVAQLSVDERSATYPLVFEPRASFRAAAPPPPPPVAVPPPASPAAPAQPTTPQVNLPAAPVLPVLTAQALAPPPIPPSPPTFASQAPLDLNLSPAALDVTPPTAVSQPPTPPVNPAPPSGARREARQRQAAAQKSGADSDASEGAEETQDAGGDMAEGRLAPPGAGMTRHDFTAVAHRDQPSAWARDALLGGGLGIAALILALGAAGRPTPRRREPEAPAPAWARRTRR